MTITLPSDLENRVQAAVHNGRFASFDDAMAEAARLLLRELDRGRPIKPPEDAHDLGPDPFLGSMHEAADEFDEDRRRRLPHKAGRNLAGHRR